MLAPTVAAGATRTFLDGSEQSGTARSLQDAMEEMPLADVHCHGGPAVEFITEEMFLEELAMPAWMLPAYFTINGENLYERWKTGTPDEKRRLDDTYRIQRKVDEVLSDFRESTFLIYLVKEMAKFFRCKPTVRDVVAARNEYTKGDPWKYVNDLFAAVKLEDVYVTSMHDLWTTPAITVEQYASAVKCRVHPIHSVTATEAALMNASDDFDVVLERHTRELTRQISELKRVGFKSHIATRAGLDIPPMSRDEIAPAWTQYRRMTTEERRRRPGTLPLDAPERKLLHYFTWQTCQVAYELDVPFHIHSGDGGEGQGNLSRQYPYNLENVARWPVDFPQKPVKIVMVHGGYPHVDQAAYMAHIFPNVWYDMSWMNPFANRGLREKLISVFETAPLSKVMFGSDAYHGLPEFNYVAGRWGRKYIAAALSALVDDEVLTRDEAVRAARMILADNANRLHKMGPSARSAE